MKIELISKEQFEELTQIQQSHPALTFQNDGYQYIDKSRLTDEDKKALARVAEILKDHIGGFSEFSNFKRKKSGEIDVRVQYDYCHEEPGFFIGVGYVSLNELLDGFTD